MADIIGEADIEIGADATPFENEARKAAESAGSRIVSGMKKAGSLASDALGATLKIGTAAVVTGVGATLGKAFSSGMGRLEAIDTAQARLRGLGMTGEEVETVMGQVSDAVMGTYFSTADMAGAASMLLTSGVGIGDELESSLESIKAVAASSGAEISDLTGIWQRMAANQRVGGQELQQLGDRGINVVAALADEFGVTAEEAQAMVSAGKVSFEDFNTAMVNSLGLMSDEVSGTFAGLKTSVDGWLGLLGQELAAPFFELGQKVLPSIVDAMSGMWEPLSEGMQPVLEAFVSLGERAADFISQLDMGAGVSGFFSIMAENANLIIPALTGALAALGPLLTNIPVLGNLFRGLSGPVGIVIGLFITMFKESEVLRDAIGNVLSTVGTVFQSLEPAFNSVSEIIGIVAGTLGDLLGNAINAVLPLIETVAELVGGVLSSVLGALVPILDQVGSVITDAFVAALDLLVPPLTELVSALIPPLMSVLEALLPVIVTLVETGLRVFSTVLEALMPILASLIEAALPVLISLVEALAPVLEAVGPILQILLDLFMPLVDLLLAVLIPAIEALLPVVEVVFGAVGTIIENVIGIVMSVIDTALALLQGNWSEAWEGIKEVFSGIWDTIVSILEAAWDIVKSVIKAGLDIIKSLWNSVWNGIKQLFSSVWNSIKSLASSAINAVKGTITGVLNSIKATWDTIWNGIKSFFSNIWEGIKSGATSGINAVWDTVTGIKDRILGFFSNAGQWLLDAGKKILQGLGDGIRNGISAATDAVGDAVGAIRDFFPWSPAKVGPFSGRGWTPYAGVAVMEGFAEGIGKGERMVARALGRSLSHASVPTLLGRSASIAPPRPGRIKMTAPQVNVATSMDRGDLDYLARRIGREVLSGIDAVSRTNIEDAYASFQRG